MKNRNLTNIDVSRALSVTPQMVSQWKNDSRLFVDETDWKIVRISVVKDDLKNKLGIS